jgi:hypothetical protein
MSAGLSLQPLRSPYTLINGSGASQFGSTRFGSTQFAASMTLPQTAPAAPSQTHSSQIKKPITYARLEDLRHELQQKPILDARSFTMDQVMAPRSFRESSFTRVTAPLLPKTGVRFIDQLNWKVSDLLRLTKDSLFDFPKAALKGGIYGAIGGFIVGAVSNILFVNRRLDFWTGLVGCLGLIGGAAIGAGITLTRECFSKLGEIRKIARS